MISLRAPHRAFCVFAIMGMAGCATNTMPGEAPRLAPPPPLSGGQRAEINNISVSALAVPPTLALENDMIGSGSGGGIGSRAGAGAVKGAGEMLAGGLRSHPYGLLTGIALMPIGVVFGAAFGAILPPQPRPRPVDPQFNAVRSNIQSAVIASNLPACLREQTAARLRDRAGKVAIAVDRTVDYDGAAKPNAGDTDLTISFDRAGWYSTDRSDKSVVLYWVGRVVLSRATTGDEFYGATVLVHQTSPRPMEQWAREPHLIEEELAAACPTFAGRLVDALFGAGLI